MKGHIRQRSKGSWSIVIDVGRNPETGKRRQQWQAVRGTKKEAERKLREILTRLETGSYIQPSKLTTGEYLHQWLDIYVGTNVRPRTAEGYRGIVKLHLIPWLGNVPLTQLQPSHLQAYYSRALKEGRLDGKAGGLSARSVLSHHRVLSEALSHAVKWGLIGRNVALAVDPPRPERLEMQTLDSDGVLQLLEAAKGSLFYALIHLAVYTGLRRSEVMGLRWKNVDLEMAELSIVQVMHHLRDGRFIFQEPKTAKGRRPVALPPVAVLALRAHREVQEADRAQLGLPLKGDDLVFSYADGSPFLPDSFTHAFKKIARRAGFDGIRFHDLRHTHASLMLKQGIHPKVVSERLGHSSIAITLDIYSHVLPGLQEDAARRFADGLLKTPAEESVKSVQ